MAWSLLFSLPGTPILYYGDEIGMKNNRDYLESKSAETGFRDSRFLHRGPWDAALEDQTRRLPDCAEGRLRAGLEEMLHLRRDHAALAAAPPELTVTGSVLTSVRRQGGHELTMVNDLEAFTHRWTLS